MRRWELIFFRSLVEPPDEESLPFSMPSAPSTPKNSRENISDDPPTTTASVPSAKIIKDSDPSTSSVPGRTRAGLYIVMFSTGLSIAMLLTMDAFTNEETKKKIVRKQARIIQGKILGFFFLILIVVSRGYDQSLCNNKAKHLVNKSNLRTKGN
jgi:hypothetical protein